MLVVTLFVRFAFVCEQIIQELICFRHRIENKEVANMNQAPSRWWPGFSLKVLFAMMTVVAIYFGIGVIRHHRELKALPKITAVGGTFAYDRSYFYPYRQVYIVAFEGRKF